MLAIDWYGRPCCTVELQTLKRLGSAVAESVRAKSKITTMTRSIDYSAPRIDARAESHTIPENVISPERYKIHNPEENYLDGPNSRIRSLESLKPRRIIDWSERFEAGTYWEKCRRADRICMLQVITYEGGISGPYRPPRAEPRSGNAEAFSRGPYGTPSSRQGNAAHPHMSTFTMHESEAVEILHGSETDAFKSST